MAEERELKVTEIDKAEVLRRMRALGAKYVNTYRYRRIISLHKGKRGESWFRIRSDGKSHFVTFKQKHGNKLAQDKFDMQVSDIRDFFDIFFKSDYKLLYFENKRIEYNLYGSKITVDKWPKLPWSLEIEGNSRKEILGVYNKLALKNGRLISMNMSGSRGYKYYGLDYEKVGDAKISKLREFYNMD